MIDVPHAIDILNKHLDTVSDEEFIKNIDKTIYKTDDTTKKTANIDIDDSWRTYMAHPDEDARKTIVTRYTYLVNITIGRVVINLPPDLGREDLVNAGIVGLTKAIDRFDPERGVSFESYAAAFVRDTILETLQKEDWIPRPIWERAKILERTYVRIEDQLGRPATEQEVASELNVDVDRLYAMLSETASSAVLSIDEPLLNDRRSMKGASINADAADESIDTASYARGGECTTFLTEAFDRLPRQEHRVIGLYYHEGMTFREIGRTLQISESRAYQLHAQAIERLRGYITRYIIDRATVDNVDKHAA